MKKIISLLLSIILAFSCLILTNAEADTGFEVKRLSVCINGNPKDSRGFCWYTDEKTASQIQIFKDGTDITESVEIVLSACEEWEGSYVHKLTVNNLESGTDYTYRVGNGEVWSETGAFTTDDGDDKTEFIAVADVQAGSLNDFLKGRATLDAALETMPNADFVANLGDFTNDSTNDEWNLYYEAFEDVSRSITLAPAAGNHDGLGVWHWFSNMFNLDTSESVQTFNGVNYSFDYGNAHFAVLNTNDLLSISLNQLNWLTKDLRSTDKDWKIVFMHKAPYSLGKDGKWPDALYLQESLTKVLDMCDVDIVFSGHDHMYLRTKQLAANRLCDDGVTYVLSGTAGAKRYEVRTFSADTFLKTKFIDALTIQKNGYGNYWNGKDWSSTKETNVGGCFNCISIDGGNLTLKSYILADNKDENGNDVITNIDTLTLTKETGLHKPNKTLNNNSNPISYAVGVVPSFGGLMTYTLFNWLPRFILIVPKIIKTYIETGTF